MDNVAKSRNVKHDYKENEEGQRFLDKMLRQTKMTKIPQLASIDVMRKEESGQFWVSALWLQCSLDIIVSP